MKKIFFILAILFSLISTSFSQTTPKSKSTKQTTVTKSGKTKTGKTIYTGSRGGEYHYSKTGKKVYERKKK